MLMEEVDAKVITREMVARQARRGDDLGGGGWHV